MEDARGRKLFANLKHAFSKDPDIDEFDTTPVLEPQTNCNPIVLENHKLGIEIWAARLLFSYAYSQLISNNRMRPSSRNLDVSEQVFLTQAVLLMNPDNATAWNLRKSLIQRSLLLGHDDLKFGALVLTKHPKSPETFAHRKWVISHFLREGPQNTRNNCVNHSSANGPKDTSTLTQEMRDLVHRELDVCSKAAAKYPNNYNAWSHRIWLIRNFCYSSQEVLKTEMDFSSNWMTRNKSDCSGYHYRQFILRAGLSLDETVYHRKSSSNTCSVLTSELGELGENILRIPGHESLWSHRRFLVHALLTHLSRLKENDDEDDSCGDALMNCEVVAKKSKLDSLNSSTYSTQDGVLTINRVLQQEKEFATAAIHAAEKEQFVPLWQKTLGAKYLHWLDKVAPLLWVA